MADSSRRASLQTAGMPHIIVELADRAEPGVSALGNFGTFALTPVAAARAFREYNWLLGTPVLNSTGNFRGMVISKSFRTVWTVSSKAGEILGVAGIVIEFAKELAKMQSVWSSKTLSVNEKGPMLLMMGSAAILRGVVGVVPAAVHLAALSAGGCLDLVGLISGDDKPAEWASKLQQGDRWVDSTFRAQWDGQNWYTFVSQHLSG
jgi:hypothetical protein